MKLSKIFREIQSNSKFVDTLLSSKEGPEFEQRIVSALVNDSEYTILKPDVLRSHASYSELKNKMLVPTEEQNNKMIFIEELEELSNSPRLVYQPFGEKSAPDILLIKKGLCLSLEIKFTEAKQKVPVWNSGLTRPDMLYMFGSYGLKDIAFFKGSAIIDLNEYLGLKGWADNLNRSVKEEGNSFAKNFTFYMRSMFNQSGNLFNDNERKEREEIAIDWAMFF